MNLKNEKVKIFNLKLKHIINSDKLFDYNFDNNWLNIYEKSYLFIIDIDNIFWFVVDLNTEQKNKIYSGYSNFYRMRFSFLNIKFWKLLNLYKKYKKITEQKELEEEIKNLPEDFKNMIKIQKL